ncbi:MAG: sulfite reductase flavoprotein subunit alpha [Burkholderiaceae bacterium]|nr:sulfite reductase flavoprotein subunit alpha [Burkholderiaceae bacterium]
MRQAVSWLHWIAGITLGTLLAVIGLTGAALSFRAELLTLANPGVVSVAPRTDGSVPLTPGGIGEAVVRAVGQRRVATITLFDAPGAAARVVFTARPGETGGETLFADPYTGELRALRGDAAFEWIEALHRWLLLPKAQGRIATGVLAIALVLFVASGLYLRWPRRAADWREWLTIRRGLRGRPMLWAIHAVAATWILPLLLVSALTGMYWSFDIVREQVDRIAGQPREPRMPRATGPVDAARAAQWPAELDRAWQLFQDRVGDGWQQASLRAPERPGQAVQITWLARDAGYDRARNRMLADTVGARIARDDRHADLAPGAWALTLVYALHTGNWSLAGRIAMALSSLGLPVLAVTGWMLYLGRRRDQRAARAGARGLAGAARTTGHATPIWVLHASQSGTAERLAVETASALAAAGQAVELLPLARLQPERLPADARVLIVAASFGDGQAPDTARRFARGFIDGEPGTSLPGWQYAVLALGDRRYPQFCGFGRALDARLQSLHATPLWPMVELDANDEAALARWWSGLQDLAGTAVPLAGAAAGTPEWQTWTLADRRLLNAGSSGAPLFEVTLRPQLPCEWSPGALVEVVVTPSAACVQARLRGWGLDPEDVAEGPAGPCTLAELLAHSECDPATAPASAAQLVAGLRPIAPRRYSIASVPADAGVQLLVRQARHEDRLGLASGWLTADGSVGATLQARLVANPAFGPVEAERPCIFIGNGSGLAGLRGHLRARVRQGARRNWLLFGERHHAHDRLCGEEIDRWQAEGLLERVDWVFSRDSNHHEYVQHRLLAAAADVRGWVADGATLFVCGSLQGMAGGVDAALRDILGGDAVEELLSQGRLRRDVY